MGKYIESNIWKAEWLRFSLSIGIGNLGTRPYVAWGCFCRWETLGRRWSGICCNIAIQEGLYGVLNSSEVVYMEGILSCFWVLGLDGPGGRYARICPSLVIPKPRVTNSIFCRLACETFDFEDRFLGAIGGLSPISLRSIVLVFILFWRGTL